MVQGVEDPGLREGQGLMHLKTKTEENEKIFTVGQAFISILSFNP